MISDDIREMSDAELFDWVNRNGERYICFRRADESRYPNCWHWISVHGLGGECQDIRDTIRCAIQEQRRRDKKHIASKFAELPAVFSA